MGSLDEKTVVNGERITVLETLMQGVVQQMTRHNDILESIFGPEGFCTTERKCNEAFRDRTTLHVRGLWTVVSFIGGSLVTVGIAILTKG